MQNVEKVKKKRSAWFCALSYSDVRAKYKYYGKGATKSFVQSPVLLYSVADIRSQSFINKWR